MSVQDRCMVYARCTIGLQIILDAPDGTLGDEAQVEARFYPFGDSANLDARKVHGFIERTVGSTIVLDAPDGTPR